MALDEGKASACAKQRATRSLRERREASSISTTSASEVEYRTLSVGALAQTQRALLSELNDLLAAASNDVAKLLDDGLDTYPLVVDARAQFDWIAETVEALDGLGWRELREAAERRVEA